MNSLRSLIGITWPGASHLIGPRALSSSVVAMSKEKYYKLTKYAKQIDNTEYKAGDRRPDISIPYYGHKYPKYAYEARFFKRQNRGLYAGLQRRSSYICSENGNKTKSYNLPNVVKAKLWSEALNKAVSTRVTTTLLRTVTREGGLDNYLMKDKPARIKTMGLKGWQLKYRIMKKKELEERSKGSDVPIYHILESGKKITATRNELLKLLYPLVYRDSYKPICQEKYLRTYAFWTTEELVAKLESYNFDFSRIIA